MEINLDKLHKHSWFKDENDNEYENKFDDIDLKDKDYLTYYSIFPLTMNEEVSEYCYHPKNVFVKWLMKKSAKFSKYMLHKHRNEKTFKHIFTGSTSYGTKWSQKCILAMVNSGDYTLEEAVYIYCSSCERCMNVLLYKYLNGEEGYAEFSEEWKKANTCCDFCKSYNEQ